ncbi:hypothetical protein JTE90_020893 [Oedothorax gibbosus]|uniref:C2H2-type domain-containing protein n=1 Tax=Oedothorax gibbosus TaxID=931172 RepID=A0AAV6U8K0_9ARAC|nr:hypothetical protein JTE90_020893 [Oedothorax gibbosus]
MLGIDEFMLRKVPTNKITNNNGLKNHNIRGINIFLEPIVTLNHSDERGKTACSKNIRQSTHSHLQHHHLNNSSQMLAHFKKAYNKFFRRNEYEDCDFTKTHEELKGNEESTDNDDQSIQHSDTAIMNSSDRTNTMSVAAEFSDESEKMHEVTEFERNFMNEQEVENIPSSTVDSVISNIFSSFDPLKHLDKNQLKGTENNDTPREERNDTGNCRVPKIKIINQSTVVTVDGTPINVSCKLNKKVKSSKNMIRTSQIESSVGTMVQNDGHHLTASYAQSKDIPSTANKQVKELASCSRNPFMDCMVCEKSFENVSDLKLHLQNHYYYDSSASTALESPPTDSTLAIFQSTNSETLSVPQTTVQSQTQKLPNDTVETSTTGNIKTSVSQSSLSHTPSLQENGAPSTGNITTSVSHVTKSQTPYFQKNDTLITSNNNDFSPTAEDLARILVPLQHVPENIFSSDTVLPHGNVSNVFPEEIEPYSLNMDTPNIGTFPFIDYDDSLYLKNTERGSIFSSDTEPPHVNESNVFPEEIETDYLNMDTPKTVSRSKNATSKKENVKSIKKHAFDYGRSLSNIVRGNILRKNNRSDNSIKSVKLSKNIIRTTQIKPSAAFDNEQLTEMPSSSMDPNLECMLCGESLENKYDLKVHLQNHYYSSNTSTALNSPPPSISFVESRNSGHKSTASKGTPLDLWQTRVHSQSNGSRFTASNARSDFSRVQSQTHGHITPSSAMSGAQTRVRSKIHDHPMTIVEAQSSNHPGTTTKEPRTCLVCRKTFVNNGTFVAHLQAHMSSNFNSETPYTVRVTPKAFVVKVIQRTYERVNGRRREAITITEQKVPIKIVPSEEQEPALDSILSFSVASEVPMKEALNQAKSQAVSEMTAPNTARKTASNQAKKKAPNKIREAASNKVSETIAKQVKVTVSNEARKTSLSSIPNDSVGPTTHTSNNVISQSFADAVKAQSLPAIKNAYPIRRSPRYSSNPFSSYCMEGYSSKSSFSKNNRNEFIDASTSTVHPFHRTESNKCSKRLATTSTNAIPTTSTTVNRNREISKDSTPSTSVSPNNKKRNNCDVDTTSKKPNIKYGEYNRTTSSVAVPSTRGKDTNCEDSNMRPSSNSVPSTSGKDTIHNDESNASTSSAAISSTSNAINNSSAIMYPNSSSEPYRNRYIHIPSPRLDRQPRNLALPGQFGRYRCINCGKSYNSMDDFNAHSMLHHEEYAKCDSCETRYISRVRPEWYHGQKLCPKCSDVPRDFQPKRSMRESSLRHIPEEENRNKLVCSYCGRKFVHLRPFKKHMNQHLR